MSWDLNVLNSTDPLQPLLPTRSDDLRRADTLTSALHDDAVHAIWCAEGGYGATRIIDIVEWPTTDQQWKPVVGFSDVTAIFAALTTQCRWPTISAPNVAMLARPEHAVSVARTRECLFGAEPAKFDVGGLQVLVPGEVEGVLVGGNLSVFTSVAHLWSDHCDSLILCIEDCGEAAYRIDRMLTQLEAVGFLDVVVGIVCGCFDDADDQHVSDLLADRFARRDVPVYTGAPIGHGDRCDPLLFGRPARLVADVTGVGSLVMNNYRPT